jgi:hypothetical protein
MRNYIHILSVMIVLLLPLSSKAQYHYADYANKGSGAHSSTIYLMPNVYPAILIEGDTVACMTLREFIKYSPLRFYSHKDVIQYNKLIRDVKKTLPYAKQISKIIIETYEYMETLPTEKAKQKHLEAMENYLYKTYKPQMSKLTRSQGQLLIKLVDRETNTSAYGIIDGFMGSFKAWTYNVFAGLFGNSLKVRYDPYGKDRLTERVCVLVEQGAI